MPRLAVLGHPVSHSRSPAMQSAALAELGLGEWSYEAIDVAPEDFEARVRAMPGEGFVGANVTVPHKTLAFELADDPGKDVLAIGAANTLAFSGGRIDAYNTDAGGLIAALPRPPSGLRALVLGAGGAARAAIWALRAEGAIVDIWNRTTERAQQVDIELAGGVHIQVKGAGGAVTTFDQDDYGLIVNATTVGLHGEDPFESLRLRRSGFGHHVVVADMVYSEAPSTLLRAAAATGAKVVDGLEILVQQGALSLQIWTGREAPLDVMRNAARG
jgi:shikimate dehydrogenase